MLNLVYDPSNPDIVNNPILYRRKEKEPTAAYDKKSLYLCGQSDRDLSQLVESNSAILSNQKTSTHFALLQKAESFMSNFSNNDNSVQASKRSRIGSQFAPLVKRSYE